MQTIHEPMFRLGVVEDLNDPLKLGRVRVRVTQVHTDSLAELPTEDLPWADCINSVYSASMSGIGDTPRLLNGSWVIVSFLDVAKQKPIVWGTIGGIPGAKTNIQPVDTNNITELLNNIPPIIPPQPVAVTSNGQTVIIEPPYIGSLTKSQVDKLHADIFKSDNTSDIIQILRTNYTNLANAGVLSIDSDPAKTAGVLEIAYFMGHLTAINYVNGTDTILPAGSNASDYYRRGYAAITGVYTFEQPTKENLSQPAADIKSAQNQNALKYDVGVTRGSGKQGFADPTGTYPLKDHLNESDLNRLARGSKISQTIVGQKESDRITGVSVALSSATWDQSPIPYAAVYPYNRVISTESGHVMEFDDTPNRERINIHHKSGTFHEIDANGNSTTRTKGIRTVIVDKDELIYIQGSGYITVDGNCAIQVKKALSIEVFGDANIKVSGNCTQEVDGDYKLTANNIEMFAKSTAKLVGNSSMEVGSSGSFTVGGSGTITNTLCIPGIPLTLTATSSGTPASANQLDATIQIPSPVTRQEIVDMTLEGAEDITSVMYQDAPPPTKVASDTTAPLQVIPVTGVCGFVDLSLDIQLTTNYTLASLCGTHPFPLVTGQHGLTAEEIACNLKQLAINVLEPLREKYASIGFKINSCFREAGSSISKAKGISQHELGMAADISFSKVRGLPNDRQQFFNLASEIKNVVPFDQLLLEYRSSGSVWIHISFNSKNLRRQVLTMNNDKLYDVGLHLLT
jgi:hypothetical protein